MSDMEKENELEHPLVLKTHNTAMLLKYSGQRYCVCPIDERDFESIDLASLCGIMIEKLDATITYEGNGKFGVLVDIDIPRPRKGDFESD